jgi:hypothetical protein
LEVIPQEEVAYLVMLADTQLEDPTEKLALYGRALAVLREDEVARSSAELGRILIKRAAATGAGPETFHLKEPILAEAAALFRALDPLSPELADTLIQLAQVRARSRDAADRPHDRHSWDLHGRTTTRCWNG